MRKAIKILVIAVVCFIGVKSVNATVGVEIKTVNYGDVNSVLEAKLTGIDSSKKYYVTISNESTTPTFSINELKDYATQGFTGVDEDDGLFNISDDWFMVKGYKYIHIAECEKNSTNYTCSFVQGEINRTEIDKLPIEYELYLFDEGKTFSIFPLFPGSIGQSVFGTHKLVLKIGLINDSSLLKKLANKTSDANSSLLAYAKANNGTTFTAEDSECFKVPYSNFKVSNGSYYYVYITYENNDGIYRDLDYVTVVMGENNMLVSYVKWDIDTSKSNNPKTGTYVFLGTLVTIALLGTAGYVLVRKRTKFPQAK